MPNFLSYLLDDVGGSSDPDPSLGLDEQQDDGPEVERPPAKSGGDDHIQVKHRLLRSPIYQIAVSRHIRTVYIPTATHLRAYLSVFSTNHSSKVVAAPPSSTRRFAGGPNNSSRKRLPHLLLYGFLDLHRDTSEWSAQGLGSSASALADLGHRLSWDVTVVEPLRKPGGYGTGTGTGSETRLLEQILKDTVPILSGGGRRFGLESGDGRWSGRTVEVGRVLMRWFRFQRGEWDGNRDTDDAGAAGEDQDTEMMGRPP
ncbi:hypothetical protein SLS62_001164 [Diatrype stigma]|uniref:Uncharacterized protein n=1 Tax=Diatrype stigma TaxID=117547 RepID=A0AAN9YRY3_9PEZI